MTTTTWSADPDHQPPGPADDRRFCSCGCPVIRIRRMAQQPRTGYLSVECSDGPVLATRLTPDPLRCPFPC